MRRHFTPGSVTDTMLYFQDVMSSASMAFAERFFQLKRMEEGPFSSSFLKLSNALSDKLTNFNSAINKFCVSEQSASLFLNLIRQEAADILAYSAAIIHEVDVRKEKASALGDEAPAVSSIAKALSAAIHCNECKTAVSFSSKTPKAQVFKALIARGWVVNSRHILCKSCASKILRLGAYDF